MDIKEVIEIITEIEKKIDVNKIQYKGISIWPLVRLELWTLLNHPKLQRFQAVPESDLIQNKCMHTAMKVCKLPSRLFKKIQEFKKFREIYKRGAKFLSRYRPIEVVFISRNEHHTDLIQDKYYNRHIDPVKELIATNYSTLKVEPFSSDCQTMPRYEDTIFINPAFHHLLYSARRILGKLKNTPIYSFPELKKTVFDITGYLELDENHLKSMSYNLLASQFFFNSIFRAIQPKAVFFACYYSPKTMGMIRACKKLNIKTIDIQHGKQGKYHAMYNHWTKVPKGGYELLPDIFWAWGEESKQNILKWMPDNTPHRVVVGGNRWLSKWIDGISYGNNYKDEDFYRKLGMYERKILVSLQTIDEPVPENLIEAMKLSPKSWIWMLRLHPQMKDRRDEIISNLKGVNINIEIDMSTKLLLYNLLKIADYLVTCWSSVCYEALVFETHSIIIHKNGMNLFEEYIKEGLFSYAETKEDIIDIIKKDKRSFKYKEACPYIETSIEVAHEAVEVIMKDNIKQFAEV